MNKKTVFIGIFILLLVLGILAVNSQANKITGKVKWNFLRGNPKMQCNDKIDNDGDGYCDFLTKNTICTDGSIPGDPDCISKEDDKEAPDCVPTTEICDNLDNDCDGYIDEDLARSCSTACGSGMETCSKGVWVSCTAPMPPENYGQACTAGIGECQATGTIGCDGQCSATPGTPSAEVCDGLDNDCDGLIDENLINCSPLESNWPALGNDLANTGYANSVAPSTNNVLWKYYLNAEGWNSVGSMKQSSPVVAKGVVYVATILNESSGDDRFNKVFAINATTGQEIWSYTAMGVVSDTQAVNNGVVYFGTANGDYAVYALNAADGSLIWRNDAPQNRLLSSPKISNNVVYINSFDRNLYAFDASTGALLWNTSHGEIPHATVAVSDGMVYSGAGSPGGPPEKFTAFDANTGNIIWQFQMESGGALTPITDSGKVYFGNDDGYAYALNKTSGEQVWKTLTGAGDVIGAAFGLVFAFNDMKSGVVNGSRADVVAGYYIYGLNATNGDIIWTTNYKQDGLLVSTLSAAISSDAKLCFGTVGDNWQPNYNASVHCLNALTGEEIWRYYVGDYDPRDYTWVDASPALVDGVLYITARNGYLYAFKDL